MLKFEQARYTNQFFFSSGTNLANNFNQHLLKKVLTLIQKIPTFTKEIKLIFIYDKLIYNKLHIVGYDFGYTVLTNLVSRLTLEKKI